LILVESVSCQWLASAASAGLANAGPYNSHFFRFAFPFLTVCFPLNGGLGSYFKRWRHRLYDERFENYKTLIMHISGLNLNSMSSTIETGQCTQISEGSQECFSVKDVLAPGHSSYILRGIFSLMFDSGFNTGYQDK